jgi:hypothetical protein
MATKDVVLLLCTYIYTPMKECSMTCQIGLKQIQLFFDSCLKDVSIIRLEMVSTFTTPTHFCAKSSPSFEFLASVRPIFPNQNKI